MQYLGRKEVVGQYFCTPENHKGRCATTPQVMTEDKYPLWKFRMKKRHVLSVFFANNALQVGSCKRMSTTPFLKIRVTGLEMQYLFFSLHFANFKLSLQYLITTVISLGTSTSYFLHWHATKPLWVITPQSAIRERPRQWWPSDHLFTDDEMHVTELEPQCRAWGKNGGG